MSDPYNLRRFVDAQDPVYHHVLRELRNGHKTGHWMWFVFPQLKGLGHSAMANEFGIASRAEAEAYLAHSLLGGRLHECAGLVNAIEGRSIEQIFGYPDDLKFRSSMTLFANVGPGDRVFQDAIDKYCAGEPDRLTLQYL